VFHFGILCFRLLRSPRPGKLARCALCGSNEITPTWNGYPCEQFVPNAAPVLRSIGNKSIAAGRNLSFTVTADDANGESLTYSAAAAQP
jgi:hypothetical protein